MDPPGGREWGGGGGGRGVSSRATGNQIHEFGACNGPCIIWRGLARAHQGRIPAAVVIAFHNLEARHKAKAVCGVNADILNRDVKVHGGKHHRPALHHLNRGIESYCFCGLGGSIIQGVLLQPCIAPGWPDIPRPCRRCSLPPGGYTGRGPPGPKRWTWPTAKVTGEAKKDGAVLRVRVATMPNDLCRWSAHHEGTWRASWQAQLRKEIDRHGRDDSWPVSQAGRLMVLCSDAVRQAAGTQRNRKLCRPPGNLPGRPC